ncbi:MAG: BamA/TamA family outer membrane protein [Candidatus Cryptobacteroides sp.]
MKRYCLAILAGFLVCTALSAENIIEDARDGKEQTTGKKKKKEVKYNEKGEIIKTGLNFGPLPVVAFDNDRGFQYGALLNIYNFGDGSSYPNPKSYWYIEGSAYTKGSMKFVLNYEKKNLFPGVRMCAGVGYYSDKALDFYGFNGFQSNYDMDFIGDYVTFDDSKQGVKLQSKYDNKGSIPKGFYRHGRQFVKAKVDFIGKILEHFYWEASYNFMWTGINAFTPKGYTTFDSIVEGGTSLYDLYRTWGIISDDEAEGGFTSAVRLGLMYDSRNVENNPTRGIWAEGHVIAAPKWLGTTHPNYKFSVTMRQYIPLGTEKVVFAYRLGYEGFFTDAPWYSLPLYTFIGPSNDYDGFGGYRTVRGLMLNRVQGLQTGFYNAEIRYRFIDFKLWNQNIAFAVSAFCDGAHVFKEYDLSKKSDIFIADPEDPSRDLYDRFIDTSRRDGFHGAAGVGLRFIMNQNFIVAFEYARCFNSQDGKGAFYINTGFLF